MHAIRCPECGHRVERSSVRVCQRCGHEFNPVAHGSLTRPSPLHGRPGEVSPSDWDRLHARKLTYDEGDTFFRVYRAAAIRALNADEHGRRVDFGGYTRRFRMLGLLASAGVIRRKSRLHVTPLGIAFLRAWELGDFRLTGDPVSSRYSRVDRRVVHRCHGATEPYPTYPACFELRPHTSGEFEALGFWQADLGDWFDEE